MAVVTVVIVFFVVRHDELVDELIDVIIVAANIMTYIVTIIALIITNIDTVLVVVVTAAAGLEHRHEARQGLVGEALPLAGLAGDAALAGPPTLAVKTVAALAGPPPAVVAAGGRTQLAAPPAVEAAVRTAAQLASPPIGGSGQGAIVFVLLVIDITTNSIVAIVALVTKLCLDDIKNRDVVLGAGPSPFRGRPHPCRGRFARRRRSTRRGR